MNFADVTGGCKIKDCILDEALLEIYLQLEVLKEGAMVAYCSRNTSKIWLSSTNTFLSIFAPSPKPYHNRLTDSRIFVRKLHNRTNLERPYIGSGCNVPYTISIDENYALVRQTEHIFWADQSLWCSVACISASPTIVVSPFLDQLFFRYDGSALSRKRSATRLLVCLSPIAIGDLAQLGFVFRDHGSILDMALSSRIGGLRRTSAFYHVVAPVPGIAAHSGVGERCRQCAWPVAARYSHGVSVSRTREHAI